MYRSSISSLRTNAVTDRILSLSGTASAMSSASRITYSPGSVS